MSAASRCRSSPGYSRRLGVAGPPTRLTALVPGAVLTEAPHLVYFLHDEVIVHTPEEYAGEVVVAVHAAAEKAGRLLFGGFPVEFPVTAAVVDSYAEAK